MGKRRGSTQTSSLRCHPRAAGKPGDFGKLCGSGWLVSHRALGCALLLGVGATACAAVRPEQRALLADPTMQHEDDTLDAEARQHVLENREGAFGGGSVRGGGCGCN